MFVCKVEPAALQCTVLYKLQLSTSLQPNTESLSLWRILFATSCMNEYVDIAIPSVHPSVCPSVCLSVLCTTLRYRVKTAKCSIEILTTR